MAFAIIALSIAATVAGSSREAVVVPVGPRNRTEEEKQCVRQRLEAIVDSSGGGRLSARPVYVLSNESWVESETQTYGVVRQQNFTYFGYHTSPWRSFAGRRSGKGRGIHARLCRDARRQARRGLCGNQPVVGCSRERAVKFGFPHRSRAKDYTTRSSA